MQAHAMTQKPPDPSAMYRWKEKMSAEAIPDRGDHNETEPVVLCFVKINLEDFFAMK